jgi:hypothetical protein
MAKTPTFPLAIDRCLTVSIADLKRWGCMGNEVFRTGTVYWERGGERVASVGYTVCLNVDFGLTFLQFDYSHDGQPVQYRVPLVSAPANIGKGLVWFFRCPFTGQRCKKLHLIEGRFMHRSAVRGAMYKRQTESKKWRLVSRFFDMQEIEEAVFEEMQKPYFKTEYRGKETRRYSRLVRKVEKAERGVSLQKVMAALR